MLFFLKFALKMVIAVKMPENILDPDDWTEFLLDLTEDVGPLGVIIAMILQAVITPIPAVAVIFLAAESFTDRWGFAGFVLAVISVTIGSVLGALLCYYIGLKGARPAVKKFIPEDDIDRGEEWFNRWGAWTLIIARSIPIFPADPLSYVAGIVRMRFRPFLISIIISSFTSALIFGLMGLGYFELYDEFWQVQWITLGLVFVFCLGLIWYFLGLVPGELPDVSKWLVIFIVTIAFLGLIGYLVGISEAIWTTVGILVILLLGLSGYWIALVREKRENKKAVLPIKAPDVDAEIGISSH
ncbi:MAG: DedA family protein [Candidatus Hodarchaeales archaeon]|jgi:membrane protein DedA with SNARE-associated domain